MIAIKQVVIVVLLLLLWTYLSTTVTSIVISAGNGQRPTSSNGQSDNRLFEPFGDFLQGDMLSTDRVFEDMAADTNFTQLTAMFQANLEDDQKLSTVFQEFKANYEKQYVDQSEDDYRRDVFKENMVRVFRHNLDALNGQSSYTESINQFADMTGDEILAKFTGFNGADDEWPKPAGIDDVNLLDELLAGDLSLTESAPAVEAEAEADNQSIDGAVVANVKSWIYDWRSAKVVGPVQNQGGCGSCTLFAAAALVETYLARKTRRGVQPLSPQQLLDCSVNYDICPRGAAFKPIYDYIQRKGITAWNNYPYQTKRGGCDRGRESRTAAKIQGWKWVTDRDSEQRLHKAVQDGGPAAVAIHVNEAWSRYKRGIFEDRCSGAINHAVLVVGYGYDRGSNKNYWIVKNSWGPGYGEGGYILMRRDHGNMCKIASHGVQVY